jgi:hypothetical protein
MKPLVPIPGDSPSLGQAGVEITGFAKPYAYQFKGSALACGLLRCMGWQLHFEGLSSLQGIAQVYRDVLGLVSCNAAPIQLLDAAVPREQTIVQ